ncbi:MAG: tetratricopeptide repeat protein [Bdellovibrionota bacterium]
MSVTSLIGRRSARIHSLSTTALKVAGGSACMIILLSGCSDSNRVEKLEQQMKQTQSAISDMRGIQADQGSAINQIRAEVRTLSGKLEEIQHSSQGKTQELEQTISQLKSRVPPPAGVPEELLNQDEEKIGPLNGDAADSFKKGLSQLRAGDFDGARQTLSAFVEANPGTAFTDNGLFWLGITYGKLGQYDRAVVSLSEVFQKYPAEDMVAPALYYLADAFLKLGSKNDAVLTLQKLVDEQGKSPFAAQGRAKLQELDPKPAAHKRGR